MQRYFRLLRLIFRISFIEQTSYRPSFWFAVVGKTLRIGLLLIFYQGVFRTVPTFANWTQAQAILLVGIFALVETTMSITFHRNFAYHLAEDIHEGTFDHTLVKPVPTLMAVGLKRIDIMDFATLIPVLIVIGMGLQLNQVHFNLIRWAEALAFLGLAYTALFALYLAIGSLTFRTVIGGGPGRLAEQVTRMGQIPTDIYTGATRLIVIYVLPITLLATTPVQTLLGQASFQLLWQSVIVVGLLLVTSYAYWKKGLASYSSANG